MKVFRKPWVLVTAVFFLTLGLTISGATAAGELARIKEKGVLVVGTSADYPPYESVDDAGKFVGFDMDMVREVGKRLGVKVEIKDMGFDTLLAALQAGKIDVIAAAMQATPERDKKVDFSDVYHEIKDAFLVKAGSDITMNSAMDAAGKRLAVQTGTIQEKWARKNLVETGKTEEDDLLVYERVDNAAMDVAAGRADILFIISDPAKDLAEKMKLKVALITGETVGGGQAIAIPEGATDLQASINKAIAGMKADGVMKTLMDKYGLF